MKRIIGVALLALAMVGYAAAGQDGNSQGQDGNSQGQNGPYPAPEIDPSQAISALVLLAGGVLVIRRKK